MFVFLFKFEIAYDKRKDFGQVCRCKDNVTSSFIHSAFRTIQTHCHKQNLSPFFSILSLLLPDVHSKGLQVFLSVYSRPPSPSVRGNLSLFFVKIVTTRDWNSVWISVLFLIFQSYDTGSLTGPNILLNILFSKICGCV